MSFKIAVVVDAQVDFMDPNGALFVPGADIVVPIIDEYLSSLTLENGYMGVVFTADTHDEKTYPDSAEAKGDAEKGISGFPPHCYQGTDGFALAVKPQNIPEETQKFMLNKGVFDMWEEQGIEVRPYRITGEIIAYGGEQDREDFFKNIISAGVDEVEVCGVASDFCIKWAISGLLARGFTVTVYDNLVAGIKRDIHQVAEEDFASYVGNGKLQIL